MNNVKINDIAKELGLSRNTVSKVLNGKHVPERTKKLVLEKASQMNYKQLSEEANRKYNILLISAKPLTNINFFIPILRAIENICFERGYQLLQYVATQSKNVKDYLNEYIKNLNVDGIICIETFFNPFIEMIMEFNIPTIFLDGSIDIYYEKYNFDIVTQENLAPIKKIIRDLYDKGIRSFGFVGDHTHCLSFAERYQAMLMASSMCRLNHNHSQDFDIPDNSDFYSSAKSMLKEIKKKDSLAEAYICANDFIARLFINAIQLNGLRCPEDIKVIGFDNAIDSRNKKPTITTVGVNSEDVGLVLVNTLVFRIKNPSNKKMKLTIETKIFERDSTLL